MTKLSIDRPRRAEREWPHTTNQPPSILCIDDDPEISRLVELRLREYEVRVLRSFHGMQGFWLAVTEKPDLIITDLNMPQGDGEYVLECLRRNSNTQGVPVIVVTGMRGPAVRQRVLELGVAGFLTKPMPMNRLLEQIFRQVKLKLRSPEPA